jgi:hypothetical protein
MATSTVSPLMRGPVRGPDRPSGTRRGAGREGQETHRRGLRSDGESGKHLLGSSVDDVNAPCPARSFGLWTATRAETTVSGRQVNARWANAPVNSMRYSDRLRPDAPARWQGGCPMTGPEDKPSDASRARSRRSAIRRSRPRRSRRAAFRRHAHRDGAGHHAARARHPAGGRRDRGGGHAHDAAAAGDPRHSPWVGRPLLPYHDHNGARCGRGFGVPARRGPGRLCLGCRNAACRRSGVPAGAGGDRGGPAGDRRARAVGGPGGPDAVRPAERPVSFRRLSAAAGTARRNWIAELDAARRR